MRAMEQRAVRRSEVMSQDPPPQFGLRTMLLGVAALAVVCGLVATVGLRGWPGVVMVVVILATAVGAFVGLWICCYAGLGFGFEDLRWDILKCLALAAITILVAYVAVSLSPAPQVLFLVPIVMAVCMKLFWLDIEGIEMMIVGFSALSATGIAAGLARHLLAG